jgi:Mg-chelatase subunit ChlD
MLIVGTVLLAFTLLPLVGLAVDIGVMYNVKALLQSASDGAAMAAARSLSRGLSLAQQQDSARETANRYFRANATNPWLRTATVQVTFPTPPDPATRLVNVVSRVRTPTYFLQLIGVTGIDIAAEGEASRRDVNVMMVIDRSGSLANAGACDDLRDAAAKFVLAFQDGRDRVGLITFGTTYRLDFPVAYDFQSRSGSNLVTMMPQISCTGGTNAAAALWTGWDELKKLNDRGALNALLFFTDGQPNTLYVKDVGKKANCTKGPKAGVLATGYNNGNPASTMGLFKHYKNLFPIRDDLELIDDRAGCKFSDNSSRVAEDLLGIAPRNNPRDAVGNGLRTGYKHVNVDGDDWLNLGPQDLENAGINALDDAARRIRDDAATHNFEAVVYSVMLGGPGAPEQDLMRRVSNVPESSIYDRTRPRGMYIYAERASELEHAFALLASDLLRISK